MPNTSRVKGKCLGFTLGELLVIIALSALFLTILTRFAVSAFRISNEELDRNRAEAMLLNLVTRFKRDLSVSSAPGLSLSSSGETFLIHPITMSDVGTVVYQPELLLWYYDPAQAVLYRKDCKSYSGFTFDGTPYRAPEADLITLGTSTEFQLANKFPEIAKFHISTNPDVNPPFIGSPIQLEVEAKLHYARNTNVIKLQETCHLRNSGA